MIAIPLADLKEDEIYAYYYNLANVLFIGFLTMKRDDEGDYRLTDIVPYLRRNVRFDTSYCNGDIEFGIYSNNANMEVFKVDVDEINKHVIMEHI